MSRRAATLAVLVAAALAGCSEPGDEPEGLGGTTGTGTSSAEPDPTEPGSTGTSGNEDSPEPEPSPGFTQPYLPEGEESVIELATELPIDVPDDATEEETAVLTAVGRFMASWDAILFGADPETARLAETATDPQFSRLVQYATESTMDQRVTVGEPTVVELMDIQVDDTTAEVDVCITMTNWVEYVGGEAEPLDAVERQVLTVKDVEGRWLVSDANPKGATGCS
ncbi:hypothetical protein [Jiangella asiatica]|uniref:Nuclear transport factor 2 family protein n=1 Tax=Jiangella asiatica TaxID=2530372 RepID=A0A4R5DQ58_9ACTN|nr:hypothetical protein [Jiangella asiatica]TDE15767.1 hypothetical protein E1269_00175 [Jiangella asiatica]